MGRFRADIQGLRAVAVLGVVLYHAHLAIFSGGYVGVDVFFVVSGFLITQMLFSELSKSGRVSFGSFYARRMRRLLPAAMLVLVVTIVASDLLLPPLQTATVWKDGVATALYGANYRFAFIQTNYLASSGPVSPFLQYWSLGVEEQFYLVWPLLLVGSYVCWRRWRRGPGMHWSGRKDLLAQASEPAWRSPRPAVIALAATAVVSFALSLWLTHYDEPWAFFSMPTRAWELAVGGLVALELPRLRRWSTGVGAAVAWSGLAAVVASMLVFTASTPFPGTAALLPVLGAAGVIAGGVNPNPLGPVMLLRRGVAQLVGDISYSFYLWHWPVLVLVPDAVGHPLAEWQYLALAAGSGVLAWATYRWVENPARRFSWAAARPRRALASGAVVTATGLCACLVVGASLPALEGQGLAPVARIASTSRVRTPGTTTPPALVHATSPSPPTTLDPVVSQLRAGEQQVAAALAKSAAATTVPANVNPPLPYAKRSEAPPFVDGCLLGFLQTAIPPCVFGDTSSTKTVVLFGDSHATMWFPAFDAIAKARHWRLVVWTKATCPPVNISLFSPDLGRPYTECDQWRQAVLARIQSLHPRLVVLGTAPNYDAAYNVVQDGPQWMAGLQSVISTIRAAGAHVLVMGPVPSPDEVVPNCLSAHLSDVSACNITPRDRHVGIGQVGYDNAGLVTEQAAVRAAGAYFVNVKPWFCTATTCPVVVEDLVVFRDNSHITVPYAKYLEPLIADEVDLALVKTRP